MGKRSAFERKPRDFYPTPYEGVLPLLPFLPEGATYDEPCAGDGKLIRHLSKHNFQCLSAYDVEPRAEGIEINDAASLCSQSGAQFYITNPPWDRWVLHGIIANLCKQKPTWLLFDADWPHTRQASSYLPWCKKIVSIGRLKWIPGSAMTGKDNCAWYLFDANTSGPTIFHGRAA